MLKILCKNKITNLKIKFLLGAKFGFLICKIWFSTSRVYLPEDVEYLCLIIKALCSQAIIEAHKSLENTQLFFKLIIRTFIRNKYLQALILSLDCYNTLLSGSYEWLHYIFIICYAVIFIIIFILQKRRVKHKGLKILPKVI